MVDSFYRYFNCSTDPVTFHCYTKYQFTVTIPPNAKFDFIAPPWESCVYVENESNVANNQSRKQYITAHHYPSSKGTYVITKQQHIHFIGKAVLERVEEHLQICQLHPSGFCPRIE